MAFGAFMAGSIVAKMALDRTKWTADVKATEGQAKGLGTVVSNNAGKFRAMGAAMTAAGAGILATVGMSVKKFTEMGDAVHKMALRTGFATTTLSELAYAAEISGADLSTLEKTVKKMQKTITDAGDGLSTAVNAFDRMGISFEDLKDLTPEEQFEKLATAVASIEDPTVRAATAQDVFGRAGTALLPLFNEGTEGMEALRAKAHELGIVFDQEAADKAARLADANTTLKSSLDGLKITIGEQLAPTIAGFKEGLADIISKFSQWAEKNPGLAKGLTAVVAGVGGLLGVMGPITFMLPQMVQGFGLLKGALGGVAGGLGKVGALGAAAFVGWKIGEAIGNIQILGKSIDDHIVDGLGKVTDKLMGVNKQVEMGAGHAEALERRQAKLAEASKIAGHEITSIHEALEILGERLNTTTPKVKTFGDEEEEVTKKSKTLVTLVETELIPAKKGLTEQVDNLTYSYISFKDVALEALDTLHDWNVEAIPAARDFSDLLGTYPEKFEDVQFEEEKTATGITTHWGDMTDGLMTKWSEMFGDFVASGDIFKGKWGGLWDGLKTQFTDTLGNMLSEFTNTLLTGIMSGASGLLSDLGSSIGSIFGGGGAESIAGGLNNVLGSLTSIVNPVSAIASAIGGLAGLAALGSKPAGFSEHMWYLRETQENTQEIRDYIFINIREFLITLIEMAGHRNEKLDHINQNLRDKIANGFLKSIDKGIGGIADAVRELAKAIKKITKAQHGMVASSPTLAMVGDVPGRIPEIVAPAPMIPAIAQAMGGGGGGSHYTFNIRALDARGVRDAMRTQILPEMVRALDANVHTTKLKNSLGVR